MVAAAGLIHSASSSQSFVDMMDRVTKANSANFDIQLNWSQNLTLFSSFANPMTICNWNLMQSFFS